MHVQIPTWAILVDFGFEFAKICINLAVYLSGTERLKKMFPTGGTKKETQDIMTNIALGR